MEAEEREPRGEDYMDIRFLVRRQAQPTETIVRRFSRTATLSQVKQSLFGAELTSHSVRFLFMGQFLEDSSRLSDCPGVCTDSTIHAIVTPRAADEEDDRSPGEGTAALPAVVRRVWTGLLRNDLLRQEVCLLLSLTFLLALFSTLLLRMPQAFSGLPVLGFICLCFIWLSLVFKALMSCIRP